MIDANENIREGFSQQASHVLSCGREPHWRTFNRKVQATLESTIVRNTSPTHSEHVDPHTMMSCTEGVLGTVLADDPRIHHLVQKIDDPVLAVPLAVRLVH